MISRLTKIDRQNIEVLCRLYDRACESSSSSDGQRTTIIIPRDQDLLLKYGFEYGMFRESMFGTDKAGQTWQVANLRTNPANNRGYFGLTAWYTIDERGVRHKYTESMTQTRFYTLFGKDKP